MFTTKSDKKKYLKYYIHGYLNTNILQICLRCHVLRAKNIILKPAESV